MPEPLDASVEQLKRIRVAAGTVAAVGVYTFVEGGFAVGEMLQNLPVASGVLLLLTPLTVGVMLSLPDLFTGDLHGLGPKLGILFILGAPVTVTAIALFEMARLKRDHGIRPTAHPPLSTTRRQHNHPYT
ncbi:hypothetical protein [Streptomyces broussonetiae]|uniref:hypothetical protein n=1 Tax=Streptomyces broussonetiae TaxID=2686304 RepID=UPI0018EF332E|nr:hypothetical protein [Streptomyces broussonetiae]